MTKKDTSIRINGSHYDALTGALLSYETTPAPVASKPAAKSIDGVVGGTKIRPMTVKVAATPKTVPKPVRSHAVAAHAQGHHVKPSATLMRHAVVKPMTASLKRRTKVQVATRPTSQVALNSHAVVMPKLSLHSVDQQRAARAAAVALSPRIGKFAHEVSLSVGHDVEEAVAALDKAVIIPQAPTERVTIQRDTTDIFEQALLQATSHEEPAPIIGTKQSRRAARTVRRRMVSFSAGAVAVLALVGIIGYHSQNVQFKRTASRAGFAVTMPAYRPAGFSVANVQATSGYLNVSYRNSDVNRTYAVTEKPTDWNSQTLLTEITNSADIDAYNTIQKSGRTVYIYGQNQAAWVHDGILYQVLGNGSLGNDEFAQIAASM